MRADLEKKLIFIDCEANGRCPGRGLMTEFGAVAYSTRETFHGSLVECENTSAQVEFPYDKLFDLVKTKKVMEDFAAWLITIVGTEKPVFVSDNPAFDWQWINYYFWNYTELGNPFGHSARRISDFYAGLKNDFADSQRWKKLRKTNHDHNSVHDALGNVEAFERMLNGER